MEANTHDEIFLQAMEKELKNDTEAEGPVRSGTVISVDNNLVFLEMGGKSEVVVPLDEFETPPAVGSKVDVMMTGDRREGVPIASKTRAERMGVLDSIHEAIRLELPVKGTVKEVVVRDNIPKGFTVDLGGDLKAFLPYSHIDTRRYEKPENIIGQKFDFVVLEKRGTSIIISRRVYLQKTVKKLYGKFFETHQVGDVVNGSVEEIDQNYIILSVEGIKAFLHISDFSWKYLSDFRGVVKYGDEFEVQIISLDKTKDSVKVGKKQLLPNPWENIENRFAVGDVIQGRVVHFRKEGAVVEVEEGIEAFLHVSEISWTQRVRDPKKALKKGAMVEVKIKNIEIDRRRMDVSLRELQANPWDDAEANYTRGKKLSGTVSSVLDFGVFIKFDDGIEGILRKEDVDWMENEVDLKERFKKGDKTDVIVLSIEPGKERLRLGIKQLSDNPLQAFSMNYPKNSVVEGTVKAIQEYGIVVALENNLEGFIHISNINKDGAEKTEDTLKVGDPIRAAVRYVDVAKAKIELSRKDLMQAEEQREFQKYIVKESGKTEAYSTSMGSLLADQFKGLKIEPEKKKTEKAESAAPKKTVKKKSKDTESTDVEE
jgi:small subunit ribosomal protein S1